MDFDEMSKVSRELEDSNSNSNSNSNPIMQWFHVGDHLSAGLPRKVMRLFMRTAAELDKEVPDGPEKSAGLRKLLEAKDCLVRASIPPKDRSAELEDPPA